MIKKPGLNAEQQKELTEVFRTYPSPAVRSRCQMVLLKEDGYSSKQIASIVRSCEVTVNKWVGRYLLEGIEGLYTKPGRGRKPILDKVADKPLVTQSIEQHRQSLKKARAAISEQSGKEFSTQTLRRFLKELTTDIKGCAGIWVKRHAR
jgi:transposase